MHRRFSAKTGSFGEEASIGPSYIRMQPISFAIPLEKLRCDFINPDDETSEARGARAIMDKLHDKVSKKELLLQSRRNSAWGKMGGALSFTLSFSFLLSAFLSSSLYCGFFHLLIFLLLFFSCSL
jgi:hypothetical protein